tara:strand:+ start:3684 stop:4319 length:636 start_codon:yes stop_codon:yes gene_type:complete
MMELIAGLKAVIDDIANIYSKFRIFSEFGLIEFRHLPTDDSPYSSLRRLSPDWTENPRRFSRMVSKLDAKGGGPYRESAHEALKLACESDWDDRSSTKRIIILAADTKPDHSSLSSREVKEAFTTAGIDQFYYLVRYEKEYDIITQAKNRTGDDITPGTIPLKMPINRDEIRKQFIELAEHSGYSMGGRQEPESETDEEDSDDDDSEVIGL